jgi:hypothetical protein
MKLRHLTAKEWKSFGLMFGCQIMTYFIFSVNARALALGLIAWTVFTDLIYATVAYYIIKLVGKNECPFGQVGYILGGAIGSGLAIILTKWVFGR